MASDHVTAPASASLAPQPARPQPSSKRGSFLGKLPKPRLPFRGNQQRADLLKPLGECSRCPCSLQRVLKYSLDRSIGACAGNARRACPSSDGSRRKGSQRVERPLRRDPLRCHQSE